MGFLDKLRGKGQETSGTAASTDPVCGMNVDPGTAAATSQFHGKTVHFCSAACKAAFDAAPEKYAAKLR